MTLDEYKTKEALDSLYPIIKKGYERGSNAMFKQ
jgi:predicted transcriptional regulator